MCCLLVSARAAWAVAGVGGLVGAGSMGQAAVLLGCIAWSVLFCCVLCRSVSVVSSVDYTVSDCRSSSHCSVETRDFMFIRLS